MATQDLENSIRLSSIYIWEPSLNIKSILPKNVRRSNRSANMLIIIGIIGVIVAAIVGILIWRAIFD
jgi:cytochrome b subunit of formate dehydrogenase